ncbi:MAG TPA: hypothetical protein VGD45_20380 [Steroidobacter sp.]|uniref:hypothetical protein n=1 Tax=Steroidobacter sp. TaxID=1978227 RepID=UPI002ED85563
MRTPGALLAGDFEARMFVRRCRLDHNRIQRARAQQAAEALQSAQSDPPFDALGEDMPELMRRMEE